MSPQVSLVMTAWRPRLDWLEVAVASALGQRDADFELVVVDDGSEPPLAELLAHVDDPRLRIERVPHGGLAAARNAGIAAARGDYVRFLDCDDAWPQDSTAQLLSVREGRDDRILYGTTMVCDADLRPQWRMTARQDGDAVVDSLLARFNVRPGSLMFPRALLEQVPFDAGALSPCEDWEHLQRALEHAHVRGTRALVHLYRRHGSAMTADIEGGRNAARDVVDRYFARHPEQRGTHLERRTEAMLDARQARVYALHGQPKTAARLLARGLARDPLCLSNEFHQARGALAGTAKRRLKVAA